MPRESKVFQQLLCEEFRHACHSHARPSDFLIPLESGLVRAIEHKERVYVVREKSKEAVVECAKRRIRAALASLDLEEPDGDVDSEA
jgi:hypothetical protein